MGKVKLDIEAQAKDRNENDRNFLLDISDFICDYIVSIKSSQEKKTNHDELKQRLFLLPAKHHLNKSIRFLILVFKWQNIHTSKLS